MIGREHFRVALDEARELARCHASKGGRQDLLAMARDLGVSSVESRDILSDGYLGVLPDKSIVIRYRSDNSANRNRFTIAHELGHILIARALRRDLDRRVDRAHYRNTAEEKAANRIASELLMPEESVERELSERHDVWAVISGLRHRFQVSQTAMVLRTLEIRRALTLLVRVCYSRVDSRGRCLFRFDTSEGGELELCDPVRKLGNQLWLEAQETNQHNVQVRTSFGPQGILCEGQMRTVPARQGNQRAYWVLGWMVRHPTGIAHASRRAVTAES